MRDGREDEAHLPAEAHARHREIPFPIANIAVARPWSVPRFAVNTVTGVWNAWEARRDPSGRTRRLVHTALMLGADVGFAYTGVIAEVATRSVDGRRRHRAAALTSVGVSTAGAAMTWPWKD